MTDAPGKLRRSDGLGAVDGRRPSATAGEATVTLAARARAIEPRRGRSSWNGHEYGRGYGVLCLPFDSGHLLGLRVIPESDFAPYVSIWHRSPAGEWDIYVDGPSLETACPRYWGPATRAVAFATIDVAWTGPADLRVRMDEPALEWSLSMRAPPLLRALNAIDSALPPWTWRLAPLLRFREWVARRYLGYGDVRLAFTAASGHDATLLARRNYHVVASTANLEGTSLGAPVRLDENPTIADVPLPAAPSFFVGEAQAAIRDPAEYRRTRDRVDPG